MLPRTVLVLLVVGYLQGAGRAQNLVPNGSFEDYYECPTSWGQWNRVEHWTSPWVASADYFNSCIGNNVAGVPYNQMGYQFAAQGQAYMGVVNYVEDLSTYREMVAVELSEPLHVGVPVCLSYKVAAGGFGSASMNSAYYTSRGLGMKFFVNMPTDWFSYMFPSSVPLYAEEVLTDTAIWYSISGQYVPDSAYTHLVMANFLPDSLSGVVRLDSSGFGTDVAYSFIDDVRVSFDLSYCTSTNVNEPREAELLLFPSPFSDQLRLRVPDRLDGPLRVRLLNNLGQEVAAWSGLVGPEVMLQVPPSARGIYMVRVSNGRGSEVTGRVLH